MRGMRDKSESRQEDVRDNLPLSRSGEPGFMHHPRTRPANDFEQHKIIGGHTYIYADWGQFRGRRKAFFFHSLFSPCPDPIKARRAHPLNVSPGPEGLG